MERAQEVSGRLALVNPPFASIHTPSIQLGLLKAICAQGGLEVEDIYANIACAAKIGVQRYQTACFAPSPDIGEWLFGHAAFGEDVGFDDYLRVFSTEVQKFSKQAEITRDELIDLRQSVMPEFVEEQARALVGYRAVGFTSTFQQNVAGLAIGRRLKQLSPETIIVMGGANYHGAMGREYFRRFDWIDYIASGESDHLIRDLFAAILDGVGMPTRTGVLSRIGENSAAAARDSIYLGPMDALPVPDYRSYFSSLAQFGITEQSLGFPIALPFETSRGCWWGAKHHCTFCGLNSVGMAFRSKSPERAGREVRQLVEDYGIGRLDATDNIIESKNMTALLEEIEQIPKDLNLFYEIKANVSADDVRLMRKAGVRRVQPGIESFSTKVLKLMNKGTTGLNNINALRWFLTFDVDPLWNILYGFPGETVEDYQEQARLVPWLLHLPPPQVVTRINLDRFSPNLELPELRSQFRKIVPFASYRYLYPSSIDIEEIAYHFVGYPESAPSEEEYAPFMRTMWHWKKAWKQNELTPFSGRPLDRPILTYSPQGPDGAVIMDSRARVEQPQRIVLEGVEDRVLRAFFDRPVSMTQVRTRLQDAGFSEQSILRAIDNLLDLRLLAQEGNVAVALPVLPDCNLRTPPGLSRQSAEAPLEFAE